VRDRTKILTFFGLLILAGLFSSGLIAGLWAGIVFLLAAGIVWVLSEHASRS